MKKVVLVTGASSGMGKDVALRLLEQGYIVYGAARRVEKMGILVQNGGHAIPMDITREDEIEAAVKRIEKEQGRLDVLINNAGYAVWGAVETVSIEDARRQFDVNIFGLASLTKKVIPLMRKQNTGKIINLSSMGGRVYTPLGAWYHATKHALEGWSDCLRIELKQFGIDVVIIEPGAIITEFGDVMMKPALKRAKGTAYESVTKQLLDTTQELYDKGKGSPASVISNLIIKAIKSKKPKARYVGGLYAKPMLFIRRWFGDAIYEKAIMSQLKSYSK
jgi:NAD(P)-dependent dehydrogenase (short-subunit alcohol dehydrogenase family)